MLYYAVCLKERNKELEAELKEERTLGGDIKEANEQLEKEVGDLKEEHEKMQKHSTAVEEVLMTKEEQIEEEQRKAEQQV